MIADEDKEFWFQPLLQELLGRGVHDFVVCSGQRNMAVIAALTKARGINLYHHFQENSAAYFALGLIKANGRPAAVVSTSGTAVAQLLPACIEAYYSGLPLVLICADRPRSARYSGAPQTIVQHNLFSNFVQSSFDLDRSSELPRIANTPLKGPLHLNLCLEEPSGVYAPNAELATTSGTAKTPLLPDNSINDHSADQFSFKDFRRPLIIIGTVPEDSRVSCEAVLSQLNCALYAEAQSGLRESARLKNLLLTGPPESLMHHDFDSVIRIGGVPTLRFWRELERHPQLSRIPVAIFSDLPFPGIARSSVCFPFEEMKTRLQELKCGHNIRKIIARDRECAYRLNQLVSELPLAEPSWLHHLSGSIPAASSVFLGNSLPLREWDLAASRDEPHPNVFSNRGANGIDGQLSTFLGLAAAQRETWGIFGDLTALYDMSAPYLSRQISESVPLRLVVVNNDGAMIFPAIKRLAPLFEDDTFKNAVLNRHGMSFRAFAELWGFDYSLIVSPQDLRSSLTHRQLLEICPDSGQTDQFWKQFEELFSKS